MLSALNNNQISCLGAPSTIWCVPAIHADLDRLISIHDQIFAKFKVGDRLIYMGNYTGYGAKASECIDELLTFRRLLLSLPGMRCSDITYLRGQQEEILHKLYQLPFAQGATDVFLWMLDHGLGTTLDSYGLCKYDGIEACRGGSIKITKWINALRTAIRRHPGHETFGTQFIKASYTDLQKECPLLFVNAGLDKNLPLDRQNDQFWWNASGFETIQTPYQSFQKVIRGYDPKHQGVFITDNTATIDGGCGFGGNLISAAFDQNGEISEILEA
ncbi:MAG: hypothetical protein CL570_02645 [Alphaproteobacteria bacterium]|nr:hypothetical protein [Alphaproteobacteria bacterium]HCQ70925.1 hypothetical protein [Rhodospirillaceae bacterium]|tara:strand:+ start:18586 stop:19404 length:819 start_codon:yes stop_codon:yes gene_type:complete